MPKPIGTFLYAISTNGAIVAYANTRKQVIESLRARKLLGKDEVFEPKMPARGKPLIFVRPFHDMTKHLGCATRTFTIERL